VKLLPLPVKRKLRIQMDGKNSAGKLQNIFKDRAQILQESILHIPDRQQMQ
jgi:hypothetical protein